VSGLVKSDSTISARYEYGPFGELIRRTGPSSQSNPFRFSTRFTDDESGLIYYGYRYYWTVVGRWINRDPTAENGGNNINLFCFNTPMNMRDDFGDQPSGFTKPPVNVSDISQQLAKFYETGDVKWLANLTDDQINRGIAAAERGARKHEWMGLFDRAEFQAKRAQRLRNFLGGKGAKLLGFGAVAVVTVLTADAAAAQINEDAVSYAKNISEGNIAYADLDAIDVALQIQNITGNIFAAYLVLDAMLK
jgi:RHS repeat-associated protein